MESGGNQTVPPALTNKKTARFNAGTVITILGVLLVLWLLLHNAWRVMHPYPEESVLKKWLAGQTIIIEKGMIFDDKWTIEEQEIIDFAIIAVAQEKNVSRTLDPNLYLAAVRFKCVAGTKGIYVPKSQIRYRFHPDSGMCEFVDFFCPENGFKKIGSW